MRWLRRVGRTGRSEDLGQAIDGKPDADDSNGQLDMLGTPEAGSDKERGNEPGDFAGRGVPCEIEESELLSDGASGIRWEFLHGGRSLMLSCLAGIVLIGADLVDPDGSNPGRVFGGVGAYLAMLLLIFVLERRNHRKRKALLPADRFGGGRFALIFAAIVLASVGREGGGNLAGWLAFSALLLGGWSDGGWIAIAAERRGVGLWRAWRDLIAGEREARRQCWVALFGESR